jgi:hypothetical protein
LTIDWIVWVTIRSCVCAELVTAVGFWGRNLKIRRWRKEERGKGV